MEFLGKGTFGSVYKIDENTAMKCPKVYGYSSLKKEFDILKNVHDLLPNDNQIVQVHDYNSKTQCYNMEYLENYQRLDRIEWKRHSKETKQQVIQQVKEIIKNLHDIGYVHHDIAMRNIMYNEKTSLVKIIDFGKSHKITIRDSACVREDLDMIKKVEKQLFQF
jgi:serine/threonine protein kinase